MNCPKGLDRYQVADSGCWIWQGAISPNGYGRCGGNLYVHRVMYELLIGPIPKDLEIDHLCRNRGCINPDHMEPVTRRENMRRGMGLSGINSRKTHCIHGHPFDETNIYWRKNGKRMCKMCGYLNLRARRGSTRFYRRKVNT